MRIKNIGWVFILGTFLFAVTAVAQQRDIAIISKNQVQVGDETLTLYQNSWALVIGINDYQNPVVDDLHYAVNDAKSVKEMLVRLGFASENIYGLYDSGATRNAIRKKLDDLVRSASPEDRIVIFFAGHGKDHLLSEGQTEGFLVPYDGDPDNLQETCLSMSEIKDIVEPAKARHVLFLVDACYAGIMGKTRSLPRYSGWHSIQEKWKKHAVQVITAGTHFQEAHEDIRWGGHSVFTYYLLEGLGRGLADNDRDGVILPSELVSYLLPRVTRDTGYIQEPQLFRMAGDGEFIFVVGKGHLPPPKKEIVRFESEPEGAVVWVNGDIVCEKTPCEREVDAVLAQVVMQKERYFKKQDVFEIQKGMHNISWKLYPNFGWLTVTTRPEDGLRVEINGETKGETPIVDLELDPGSYEVTIVDRRFVDQSKRIEIEAGEEKKIGFEMKYNVGWISVDSDPPGMKVFVGENEVGYTPIEKWELPQGRHTVKVADPKYYEQSREITLRGGESKPLDFGKMKPITGTLQIAAEDPQHRRVRADVYLDGEKIGEAPGDFKVIIGEYEVKVSKGNLEWKGSVEVKEGQVRRIEAKLKPIKLVTYFPIGGGGGYRGAGSVGFAEIGVNAGLIWGRKEDYSSRTPLKKGFYAGVELDWDIPLFAIEDEEAGSTPAAGSVKVRVGPIWSHFYLGVVGSGLFILSDVNNSDLPPEKSGLMDFSYYYFSVGAEGKAYFGEPALDSSHHFYLAFDATYVLDSEFKYTYQKVSDDGSERMIIKKDDDDLLSGASFLVMFGYGYTL